MTNAELIDCIQAEEQGKVVEYRLKNSNETWAARKRGFWDINAFDYRIAREPRKCWVKWIDDGSLPTLVQYVSKGLKDSDYINEGWQLVTEEIR